MLDHYGAMQKGSHRRHAMRPGEPDRRTGTGRFIDLWKLARVISHAHVPATPAP